MQAELPAWPTLTRFAFRPREALMWVPRALDIARLAAVCRGQRVVDVGAGTGLLARLLATHGIDVRALDAAPASVQHHKVEPIAAHEVEEVYGVAIVSWMEAGEDYRDAAARLAPVIVNVYDMEGGCGVMGATDFTPLGYTEVATWRTPSFEDLAFLLERPGRGLRRPGHPGNRIDVLTREPARVEPLAAAVRDARAGASLPWESELERMTA